MEDFYSPESYADMKYSGYGINPQKPMDEWWNGITMPSHIAALHQCKRCQRDTKLFFDLRKKGKDVSLFEDLYKSWMTRKNLKVECTIHCFWYDYFKNVRRCV